MVNEGRKEDQVSGVEVASQGAQEQEGGGPMFLVCGVQAACRSILLWRASKAVPSSYNVALHSKAQ